MVKRREKNCFIFNCPPYKQSIQKRFDYQTRHERSEYLNQNIYACHYTSPSQSSLLYLARTSFLYVSLIFKILPSFVSTSVYPTFLIC